MGLKHIWNNWRKGSTDPYLEKTFPLNNVADPYQAIENAIWNLILNNTIPAIPQKTVFSNSENESQIELTINITDVKIQTFYVVYPERDINLFSSVDEIRIAKQVIKKILLNYEKNFEPYFKDKLGDTTWDAAKSTDQTNSTGTNTPSYNERIEAIWEARLVEVIISAEKITEPQVVGRESLAVEVTRLREQGKDPKVLGAIFIQGSARPNLHLREFSKSTDINHKRPILFLEGRNAREFLIGSNSYDDVQMFRLPSDIYYKLIFMPNQYDNPITIKDSSGKWVQPSNSRPLTWELKPETGNSYYCKLTYSRFSEMKLSEFKNAPEIPPAIRVLGRVLPRETATVSEPLINLLRDEIILSSIELLEETYLCYTELQVVYVLSTKPIIINGVRVEPGSDRDKYILTDTNTIMIGNLKCIWHLNNYTTNQLPDNFIGWLEYSVDQSTSKNFVENMLVPEDETNTSSRWTLGNWRQNTDGALQLGSTPILQKNPDLDPLLSRAGNLILEFSRRDRQNRPVFNLSLVEVEKPLPMFAKTSTNNVWNAVLPPSRTSFREREYKISDLDFVGPDNELVFGTAYYKIKTSGTRNV